MFNCILLWCYKNRSQLKNSSKNKTCKCSTKFFIWLLIYTYFIDYLVGEKLIHALVGPLDMRSGCDKCRGLIGDWLAKLAILHGDSYPRQQYQTIIDHQLFDWKFVSAVNSVSFTITPSRHQSALRQPIIGNGGVGKPNLDATLQFAGQSLATPASASRPGTHLNNDNLRDCSPANFWRQRLRK